MQLDVSRAFQTAKDALRDGFPVALETATATAAVLSQSPYVKSVGKSALRVARRHPALILVAAGIGAALYFYGDRLHRTAST